jgi:hypothetical protein
MWNLKINVVPVIIGVVGTISVSFRKYLTDLGESTKSRNF